MTKTVMEKSAERQFKKLKVSQKLDKKKAKKSNHLMLVGSKAFKVSTSVFREIRRYQSTTNFLIPKFPFAKLIRDVLIEYGESAYRIQPEALQALQEAAETYLVQYFEDSYACTLHARRCTLVPRDMALIQHLRGTIL